MWAYYLDATARSRLHVRRLSVWVRLRRWVEVPQPSLFRRGNSGQGMRRSFFTECAKQQAPDPEVRYDRPYDERSPGTVLHPNGGLVASGSRWFQAASCRAVLALHDERRSA